MAINACFKAYKLLSKAGFPTCGIDPDALAAEKERNIVKLMMCWQHAVSLGSSATAFLFKAFLHARTLLQFTTTFRKRPTSTIRAWMLPKLDGPFNEFVTLDISDWDISDTYQSADRALT